MIEEAVFAILFAFLTLLGATFASIARSLMMIRYWTIGSIVCLFVFLTMLVVMAAQLLW